MKNLITSIVLFVGLCFQINAQPTPFLSTYNASPGRISIEIKGATRTIRDTINGKVYSYTLPASGSGTVTQVGLSMPANSFSVTNSPITTAGNIIVSWSGTSGEYIAGNGARIAFPAIPAQYNLIPELNSNKTGTYPNETFNVVPTSPSGGILFNSSGTITGSNSFFWDNANGWVGLGTNVPLSKLHLKNGSLRIDSSTFTDAAAALTINLNPTGSNKNLIVNVGGGDESGIQTNGYVQTDRINAPASSLGLRTEQGLNGGIFLAPAGQVQAIMRNDGFFGINVTNSPSAISARLHVEGTLRFVTGNEGVGKYLKSDGNGNATWQYTSNVLVTDASSLGLSLAYTDYVYKGSSGEPATWTLPPVLGYTNTKFTFRNRGTGSVNIVSNAGGNNIWLLTAGNSTQLDPGDFITIINDGDFWIIQ